ncbi:hypothetical protein A5792_09265 [Mycolicibacterium peregrinum]|uniref:DUF6199 domain-containing protein n=1 Tax=Mycolicibacterium peregrinum TaxID=43304 RepID=A0A1A0RFP1_MYCPR|nr:DUF6199 family natural product biosynthesis protein [Mycolicibacterium peregrinum]OBB33336.1 hypothetical protein A5792_09265 [Mycolicibacterium peregrinum]
MGVGIFLIVVGVLVGGVMAAAPKRIWWATQSWKFRNPEANEPSDAAYGLTRAGGVFVILLALFVGWSVIHSDFQRKNRSEAQAQQQAAEAAFVVPQPETRGLLPVIGYIARYVPVGVSVDLYYTAPSRSVPGYIRTMSERFTYPCASVPTKTPGDDGRLDVTIGLSWAPERLGDMDQNDSCRIGNGAKLEKVSLGPFPAAAPMITTSGPILTEDGKGVAAAVGNVVPELAEVPNADGSVPRVSDRGALPIVGYAIEAGSGGIHKDAQFLEVSYLVPKGVQVEDGISSSSRSGGCQAVPTVSGLGTSTVTVNVRLRWSEAGQHPATDDAQCRAGGSQVRVKTSRWGEITDSTTIVTDGPVSNEAGVEVSGAVPGNRVPRS